ncbi:anti-sigma factor family protein [Demequina pelophila]|uniref:anti-sigma factor family protein n=1 Tax=Demequina pelophila TaxID=1638984 RepID=UPI000786586C|nr:zf-HC2 domain-containing protein [Demequina pelophila]
MTGRHLGDRVHDLLDHRLSPAATAEAMAHLDGCAECRLRWHDLRLAREALHSSEAGIDVSFAQRLLDREHMASVASREDDRRARAACGRDRRPVLLAASSGLLLTALLGAAYVAGAPADLDPDLSASADGTLSVAQGDSEVVRNGELPGEWIYPDWTAADLIAQRSWVSASDGSEVLVLNLVARGRAVTVLQQRGRLDTAALDAVSTASVGDVDAYVVRSDPPVLVWQDGALVLAAECSCAMPTLESVVEAFPANTEPGPFEQIRTGLGVFVDALTGQTT